MNLFNQSEINDILWRACDTFRGIQVSGNFPIALLLGGKGLSKGQPAPDPLEPLAEENQVRGEQHIQIATGGYIAQASGGSTATGSVNKLKD
jgi:hypothetical protein